MAEQAFSDDGKTAGPVCPTCGKPRVKLFRPFCSKRCADVDLARWLAGTYAIPAAVDEDEDGDDPGTLAPGDRKA